MPGKTVVVIPTYNEAENLPALFAELHALGIPGLEVLVVDDNSPDGTGQVADALAVRYPGALRVHHRPGKEGLGRAYVDGLTRALDAGADQVVQMDADFLPSARPPSPSCCRHAASATWWSAPAT